MAKGPVISITLTADDKTGRGFKSATANAEGFGKKLSTGAVAVGTFAGNLAAQAVPHVIDFGKELFTLGNKYDTMAKKADTVFGDQSKSVSKWADSVNESFGLADEEVIGLAASMGDLLVPMGFQKDEAAKLTTETLDAAAALSAWSGGQYDTAQVSDILTKAMLGERDSLKALGISINQAEVDERALTIAKKEGRDEITAMDQALATQQLMLEKSTDAQNAWKDGTMDGVKAQNEIKAAWADGKAELAEGLLPIVQQVTAFIAEDFIPWVKDLIATFQENWPEIQAAVEPVLNWFQETIEDVTTIVMALWDKFGQTIIEYTQGAFDAIMQIVDGVLTVIKGIIDTVLGVLTGDWDKAWNGIKDIVSGVWDLIKGIVDLAINQVKTQMKLVWDAISDYVTETWDGIKEGISSAVDAVVGFVTAIPGRISDAVSGAFDALWTGFKDVINRIINGWNGLSFSTPKVSIPFAPDIPSKTFSVPQIPNLAEGGIITARPGGLLARIGEGRYDEAVIPLKPGMSNGLGGTYNTYINMPNGADPSQVVQAQRRWESRNGPAR